jgi:molybdopterin molybdotransferase
VPDDRAAIRAALAEALRADVVLSSGGVSVGDFDFVKEAFADLGVSQEFWRVAMKPGKPIAFGTRDGRPVFGLPGNPASSMVSFELFVRPALRRLLGFAEVARPRAPVVLDEPCRQERRRHFLRGQVRRDSAVLRARPLGRQGSGMLRSLVGVNALIDVPEGERVLEPGATVDAVLLETV